jgi:hypothetical protein
MIPKIIHQIWIGPHPKPLPLLETWKNNHPEYEYILWDENEIIERNMIFKCQRQINAIKGPYKYAGIADIMRYEILSKYGGVYLDADSICLSNIDNLLSHNAFATFENEIARPGLIANGNIGTTKNNPIFEQIINHISNQTYIFDNNGVELNSGNIIWKLIGPALFSNFCVKNKGLIDILPSYYFLPSHPTGVVYKGHRKVYAYQLWGSTTNFNSNLKSQTVPAEHDSPSERVTILMPFLNVNELFFTMTLQSIIDQQGLFWIDLICINDGSDSLHSSLAKRLLSDVERNSRWINIIYVENTTNMGLGYSLNKGVLMSDNEIIFRMDADDIMMPNRMVKQLEFMKNNTECALLGCQINLFESNTGKIIGSTNHPTIKWSDYIESMTMLRNHWMMNHPTFCFRRSRIIAAGNYNPKIHSMYEDFDLILKVMKRFGIIYNMPEILLNYRIHKNQLTHVKEKKWSILRNILLSKYLYN